MQKTYTYYVQGMHCQACVILTESELKNVQGVVEAKTSLKDQSVNITGDFDHKTPAQILSAFTEVLKPHGYTLSQERGVKVANWSDFVVAVPAALLFIAFFLVLQKLGIVNLVDATNVSYGTAFVVGLIASVSTCMAIVGGIVLSVSANFAKEGEKTRPQAVFHIGRLISFFVLGGVIGSLGSVFQIGPTGTLVLGLVVVFVLLVLGMNLLDIVPWARKLQLTMPTSIGMRINGLKSVNHVLTPLLVGIVTFFLPCGFTQSMQIYTLTTGSFWKGGFTMLAFALGTFPVLALLSFSTLGIQKKTQSGMFFKTAGLIVIFFAMYNLMNTLVGAGIIRPIFNS
jgi:sulfite exporter TauE/SafE/copper chaperone CopZ